MGKSDLLKNEMKSGLDGLLSSTKQTPQKKEQVSTPAKAEKSLPYIVISLSTRASIPG